MSILNKLFSFAGQPARPRLAISLQGGGAKCCAYLGVFRALEEHGIEVDCIVGSSAGAMIGAPYAAGFSIPEIQDFIKDFSLRHLFSLDAIRDHSLISDEKALAWAESFFNGREIQNTSKQLFIQATNLESGVNEYLHQGKIARAIIASTAIPFLLPPIEIDNHIYIDGDTSSTYGADFLRANGYDRVLAITAFQNLGDPRAHPSIGTDAKLKLARAFEVIKGRILHYDLEANPVDCLLQIEVKDVGLFEFSKVHELTEVGYKATIAQIDEIKALIT